MKVCTYCNSQNDDNAKTCSKCNAAEFQNVCNNCKTVFKTGFCPSCGTRAGEQAKTCDNCGTKTFSPFCPSCGSSLGAGGGTKNIPAQVSPTYIVVNQQPQQRIQVAPPPKKGNGGMIALTIFFPFITAWIILFSPKYEKGMQIFALVYCSVISVAAIGSGAASMLLFMIAPVIGYGIKYLIISSKEKKKLESKPNIEQIEA